MKLNLRRAASRRLPKRERVPLYVPEHPDTVWSADFMLDALACGRSFRTFNIIDDFNREIVHIEVDTSITSQRLVRIFEQIRQERPLDEFSFPSGHTLHAVAFTLVALAHYPGLAPLLIPFAACVAASRVVLGLHYPSDVLAATVIGSVLAGLSIWLVPGVSLLG